MAHNHNHGHHGHEHPTSNYNRAFAIGTALNVCFVIVEAVYGILAHSVALLADAGHNASDVLSLGEQVCFPVVNPPFATPMGCVGLQF